MSCLIEKARASSERQTKKADPKAGFLNSLIKRSKMVGERGFEPPAPASRSKGITARLAEILAFVQRVQWNGLGTSPGLSVISRRLRVVPERWVMGARITTITPSPTPR
jgi:hypothetical protein